jgi:hypothetical protein
VGLIKLGVKGHRDYHNKLEVTVVRGGLEIQGTFDAFGKHFKIPHTRYELPVSEVGASVCGYLVVDKATNVPVVIFDEVFWDGVYVPYNFQTSKVYEVVDLLVMFDLQPNETSMDSVEVRVQDRELPPEPEKK